MDGDERLTSKSKEFICCRECDDGWDVEEEEEEEREAILDQKRGKTVWTVLTEAGVKQTHQCFSECKAHDSQTIYLDGGLVNASIERKSKYCIDRLTAELGYKSYERK